MYARFTEHARNVLQLAVQEAQRRNHAAIDTEHILLGLALEGGGVAAKVLTTLGVEPPTITAEIEKIVPSGAHAGRTNKLPQTSRAKRVIEYSMEESRILGDDYLGTEHILLGLLREDTGCAAQALANLGLRLEKVRAAIYAHLQESSEESPGRASQGQWPFVDLKNVAVITLMSITNGSSHILHVSHDADDGMWQFLDGSVLCEENGAIVSLEEITRIDPSVMELADLPLGWYAYRSTPTEPWRRRKRNATT